MRFEDDELEEFKDLYFENYGEVLNDDLARAYASELIDLVETVDTPLNEMFEDIYEELR